MLQCVNGRPSFLGRLRAISTTNASSWSVIRRGRPAPQCGSSTDSPWALNAWITSRTVSGSAATSRAIAGTGVPDEDARMINPRRYRMASARPRRRTRRSRNWPSSSVNRRARTGLDMTHLDPPRKIKNAPSQPKITHRRRRVADFHPVIFEVSALAEIQQVRRAKRDRKRRGSPAASKSCRGRRCVRGPRGRRSVHLGFLAPPGRPTWLLRGPALRDRCRRSPTSSASSNP